MAISGYGDFLVTASHDRSIRIWERSEEQVFLEEEQEDDLDAMFESTLEEDKDRPAPGDDIKESVAASKRDLASIKAAERIIEALELVEQELEQDKAYEAVCVCGCCCKKFGAPLCLIQVLIDVLA
jgi:U3 small nucleolar RNA-associated protein 12